MRTHVRVGPHCHSSCWAVFGDAFLWPFGTNRGGAGGPHKTCQDIIWSDAADGLERLLATSQVSASDLTVTNARTILLETVNTLIDSFEKFGNSNFRKYIKVQNASTLHKRKGEVCTVQAEKENGYCFRRRPNNRNTTCKYKDISNWVPAERNKQKKNT